MITFILQQKDLFENKKDEEHMFLFLSFFFFLIVVFVVDLQIFLSCNNFIFYREDVNLN